MTKVQVKIRFIFQYIHNWPIAKTWRVQQHHVFFFTAFYHTIIEK